MRNYLLIANILLFSVLIFAQKNEKIDYNNLKIVEYQVTGIQHEGHANLLSKQLTANSNNYFCYINVAKEKCFTLSKKSEDINLNIRGSKFKLLKSEKYSDKKFIQLYYNCSKTKNLNELPSFVNTNNTYKDDLNYYNIKRIYNKKH